MIKNYLIFGKHVQVNLHHENNTQRETILKHFSYYTEINNSEKPFIIIHILKDDPNTDVVSVNPKIHFEVKNGFKIIAPKITVEYKFDKEISVNLILENQKNRFIKYLKKLYNNQYSSIDERISQILYELVLVPSVYFRSDSFLVHSSAFKSKNKGAILIGGTGGVGKTSLEIELCMNRNYSFIADDISVVDEDANVWPNLALPKIYAYNLHGNEALKKKIFHNRALHDKLAWKFKYILNGPAGVRRTISPKEVYGNYEKDKTKINKYYILLKKDVPDISVESITTHQASEMTVKIIQTEYAAFNNHVLWHEFNTIALKTNPILKLDDVFTRWGKMSSKVFEQIECYLVNIPLKIDHQKFIKKVADIISEK